MTEMIECPQCRNTFVVPPGRCADCGAEVAGPDAPAGGDVVVQYRLNNLAAAGGTSIAGVVTGAASLFLGRPTLGLALFLGGLAVGALILFRT